MRGAVCDCVFVSSRRRHRISRRDWSSDVYTSDLGETRSMRLLLVAHGARLAPDRIEQPRFLIDARSEERRVGKECCVGVSRRYCAERGYGELMVGRGGGDDGHVLSVDELSQ